MAKIDPWLTSNKTLPGVSTKASSVPMDGSTTAKLYSSGVSANALVNNGGGWDSDNAPRNKAEVLISQGKTVQTPAQIKAGKTDPVVPDPPKTDGSGGSGGGSSSGSKAVTNEKKVTSTKSSGGGGGGGYAEAVMPTVYYVDTTAAENQFRKMIEDAQAAQIEAQRAAIAEGVAGYEAQKAALADDYARSAQDIYRNARLAAIGNNEVLANLGLAGNLYASPMSGYSETSRIAQDNALRTNIANNYIAQREAEDDIAMAIAQLEAEGKREEAQIRAQNNQYLIDVLLALEQMRMAAYR